MMCDDKEKMMEEKLSEFRDLIRNNENIPKNLGEYF
jgi:hypothetical protein